LIAVVLDCSIMRCSIHERVGFSYREDGERESRTTESKDGSDSLGGNRHTAILESRSITSTAALSKSTMGSGRLPSGVKPASPQNRGLVVGRKCDRVVGLQPDHLLVNTGCLNQLVVSPLLHNPPLIEHQDLVGILYRAESMCDNKRCP